MCVGGWGWGWGGPVVRKNASYFAFYFNIDGTVKKINTAYLSKKFKMSFQ